MINLKITMKILKILVPSNRISFHKLHSIVFRPDTSVFIEFITVRPFFMLSVSVTSINTCESCLMYRKTHFDLVRLTADHIYATPDADTSVTKVP
jgi:hypothetical protein